MPEKRLARGLQAAFECVFSMKDDYTSIRQKTVYVYQSMYVLKDIDC